MSTQGYNHRTREAGMSIIELLMICSLVFILASLVIVATNPVGAGAAARNAERWNAVNALGNAIFRARADGNFITAVTPGTTYELCRREATKEACAAKGALDITSLVPQYLGNIPVDPANEDAVTTGYTIRFISEGRMEVSAKFSEDGDRITSAR